VQEVYLLSVHSLAFISVWLAEIEGSIIAGLWSAIALSLGWQWLRHVNPKSRWFIERVTQVRDGRWEITWGDGASQSARLLSSYAHQHILILYFAINKWLRLTTVVVLFDSADCNDIRRLRGLLRTLDS
jgi:hypothetical protein